MKKHRFFINTKIDNQDEIVVTEENIIHQMKDVLRLRTGDPVILLDGEGKEYHGLIKILIKKESIISKEIIKDNVFSPLKKITLASAMIKKDKYEWVLQKGTEIGVSCFTPVITDRTEKVNLNMDRADKIIREASEQSERGSLPIIGVPQDLESFIKSCNTKIICFTQDANQFDALKYKDVGEIAILVGPEGGFSEKDLDIMKKNNVECVSLGNQVLRAETAAILSPALFLLPR